MSTCFKIFEMKVNNYKFVKDIFTLKKLNIQKFFHKTKGKLVVGNMILLKEP